MEIITSNKPRHLVSFYEMPQKVQDANAKDCGATDTEWFSYKRRWYRLDDFMCVHKDSTFEGWHGYSGDTFFSGTLVKLVDYGESVIVGRYYC